jgi:methyl-accepting chemotaxis protein/methyl-accepting chemotaxis protein-1 (serine sensor receptor)
MQSGAEQVALALNAAVEAARAGEAGMGFAGRGRSPKPSTALCAGGQGWVATAVRSITESGDKVTMLVEEVKLSSEEQSRGIEQVAKAITQMEKLSQTTAANAEQRASASEELTAQSDILRAIRVSIKRHGRGCTAGGGQAFERPRPSLAVTKKQTRESQSPGPTRYKKRSESPKHTAVAASAPAKREFPLGVKES